MYKYYQYAVITFIWFISSISFASGNIQKTTNTFNFKNLSAQKHYAALDDYGVYDPAKAIEGCSRSLHRMAVDDIWPADQSNPFPPPEPTPSDCEISSQMAYGCTNYASTTGRALTKSVVGIMRKNPHNPNYWDLICTGTIIDNQWILTAAHCVIDNDTIMYPYDLIVVPWQQLQQTGTSGVPTILEQNMFGAYKIIKVRSVNIPKAYTDVVANAYSPDLALLKIEAIKPYMGLEPISVANTSILNKPETPVISAGYGKKEDQAIDGQLRYRKNYYITTMYDSSWFGGISNNYGNIYMLDSKPIDYKGVKSAWSFSGAGDSGGPILSYNNLTGKFQIEGVFSGSLFCNYAGYFAKLPYPYSRAASTTYPLNYNFIKSVINGTPQPSQVRCNGICSFKTLYVIDQTNNNINKYHISHNNDLFLNSKVSTENYPSQIAFRPEGKALVTNFISNSISEYDVNFEGDLIKKDHTIHLEQGQSGPVDIAFLSDTYMVVLAKNTHSLLKYDLRGGYLGNWYFSEAERTLINPTHLNRVIINKKEDYLLVNNEHSIAVYAWDDYDNILTNTDNKFELSRDMGKLIEIKPFGEYGNQELYVLTTTGVYIYKLTRDYRDIIFTLVGKLLNSFATDTHLVPLYANSFAISKRDLNSVLVYEVAQDNTITLENHITIPEPGDIAFDNGVLYISSFQRSLYSYTISYPHLTVSKKSKVVETGEGPTLVKINQRYF